MGSVLGVAVVMALFAGFLTYRVAAAVRLHSDPQGVSSVPQSDPPPRWSAAVEQTRQFVRMAVTAQNIPGLSVAVGAGGTIVWAEGFGWRDLETRAPVTLFHAIPDRHRLDNAHVRRG